MESIIPSSTLKRIVNSILVRKKCNTNDLSIRILTPKEYPRHCLVDVGQGAHGGDIFEEEVIRVYQSHFLVY